MGNNVNHPHHDLRQPQLVRRRQALRHRLAMREHVGRERKRSRRIVIGVLAGFLTLPVVGTAVVLFALSSVAAGTVALQSRSFPADSLVYDRTGNTLLAEVDPAGATRLPVPLTQISPLVQQAIVAGEETSFLT